MESPNPHGLRGSATAALVVLRMLIGWHFLYEGLAKLTNPSWTAASYLQASQGWFSETFQSMALNPTTMGWVDPLNAWALTLVGFALLVGVLERPAAAAGIALLTLYYVAMPPFPGLESPVPTEGSYLIVNKVLVEAVALWVVFTLPTSRVVGLSGLIAGFREAVPQGASSTVMGEGR